MFWIFCVFFLERIFYILLYFFSACFLNCWSNFLSMTVKKLSNPVTSLSCSALRSLFIWLFRFFRKFFSSLNYPLDLCKHAFTKINWIYFFVMLKIGNTVHIWKCIIWCICWLWRISGVPLICLLCFGLLFVIWKC